MSECRPGSCYSFKFHNGVKFLCLRPGKKKSTYSNFFFSKPLLIGTLMQCLFLLPLALSHSNKLNLDSCKAMVRFVNNTTMVQSWLSSLYQIKRSLFGVLAIWLQWKNVIYKNELLNFRLYCRVCHHKLISSSFRLNSKCNKYSLFPGKIYPIISFPLIRIVFRIVLLIFINMLYQTHRHV